MPRQTGRRLPSTVNPLKSAPCTGMADYVSTEVSQQDKAEPCVVAPPPSEQEGTEDPCQIRAEVSTRQVTGPGLRTGRPADLT